MKADLNIHPSPPPNTLRQTQLRVRAPAMAAAAGESGGAADAMEAILKQHMATHMDMHAKASGTSTTTTVTAQPSPPAGLAAAAPAPDVAAEVGLHDYQTEFLVEHDPSLSQAIRRLLMYAEENCLLWEEIFRTVHCTAEGQCSQIENAFSKSLRSQTIKLAQPQWEFLNARVANVEGVLLEDRGPVRRAVKNTAKAVRCAIDWAMMLQVEKGQDVSHMFAEPVQTELGMHDYQEDFLDRKLAQYRLSGDRSAPLRCLLNYAAASPSEWPAMFRTVHCLRDCEMPYRETSDDEARTASKKPVSLALMPAHAEFLAARVANVEHFPTRATGATQRDVKDVDKAARCLIDWAIVMEESGTSLAPLFGGDHAPWAQNHRL